MATWAPTDPAVAVRSSATAEDLPEMSFAGQQDTYLNVRGGERRAGGREALLGVALDGAGPRLPGALRASARKMSRSPSSFSSSCRPTSAGILFTANPMTGVRDEVMINAAWGLGEAIVGGHVTPDTFIVDKQTGAIASQQDRRQGRDDGAVGRKARAKNRCRLTSASRPSLEPPQATELAAAGRADRATVRPADGYRMGNRRGHASPSSRRGRSPRCPSRGRCSTGPCRSPKGRYGAQQRHRAAARPALAAFATLAIRVRNEAYREPDAGLSGSTGVFPERVSSLTINDYAYYDFSHVRRVANDPGLPRLIPRARSAGRGGPRRGGRTRRGRDTPPSSPPGPCATWPRHPRRNSSTAPARSRGGGGPLSDDPERHPALSRTGARSLFTFFVQPSRSSARTTRPRLTYLLGFDSAPILAEKSLYDLAMWARTASGLADYLSRRAQRRDRRGVSIARPAPIADAERWREFCRRFAEHLDRFGHAVYDLDFAKSLAGRRARARCSRRSKFFLTRSGAKPARATVPRRQAHVSRPRKSCWRA